MSLLAVTPLQSLRHPLGVPPPSLGTTDVYCVTLRQGILGDQNISDFKGVSLTLVVRKIQQTSLSKPKFDNGPHSIGLVDMQHEKALRLVWL